MKLHLGCGKRFFKGYVHVDIQDYDHVDYKTNVDNLSIFEDDTASLIYASHVLEYFDFFEAKRVLKEWRRVLKPGGTLRISVPDFDSLLKVYSMTNRNIEKIIGPLFGRISSEKVFDQYIYHKTVYNFSKIKDLLSQSGFINVRKYDWRQTETKDYDDHSKAYFPHMDKDKGIQISLNIEADNG